MNRCEVVFRTMENETATVIVYGPTPAEYREQHRPGSWVHGRGTVMEVRSVREKYLEEVNRRIPSWWERCAPPARFFFTKHLAREGVVGGARANIERALDADGREPRVEGGTIAGERFSLSDGEEA